MAINEASRHLRDALLSTTSMHHHLDRRVDAILERAPLADPDELLNTPAVADWFGVSVPWLEAGRSKGYGPPFLRISARMIRYRRGDVLAWLEGRKQAREAEYVVKLTGKS